MSVNAAGIVFSNLNSSTLSRLTGNRTVAAIPFACRYRLIDFCLSNLVNAEISNIAVVTNYNYESLAEHIGSGKDWDLARRKNGIKIISPYRQSGTENAKLFSTHLEALKTMKDTIASYSEEYIVIMDSDTVLNIDIKDVIRSHEKTGANVTLVTRTVDESFSSKHPRMMLASVAGKVTDIALSDSYLPGNPELSLAIFVMKKNYLLSMIEEANAYNLSSLIEMLQKNFRHINVHSYCYNGYAASVSSFLDYYKESIRLATDESARENLLWKPEAPIYTYVHNSAPTVYAKDSHVESSMIADDCVIKGTVINSIVSRGVKIETGAVVKNCVLFYGTTVGENATLECIVADKNVTVSDGVRLSGTENMPFYIQKGRKV